MQIIVAKSLKARVKKVKELVLSAGNQIGNVHFLRRTDGTRRRMSYRLHVQKPTYAALPTGKKFKKRKSQDSDNLQVTVFDVNKITYDKKGKMNGRGAWRTVPLENVTRVSVNGMIYKIVS